MAANNNNNKKPCRCRERAKDGRAMQFFHCESIQSTFISMQVFIAAVLFSLFDDNKRRILHTRCISAPTDQGCLSPMLLPLENC